MASNGNFFKFIALTICLLACAGLSFGKVVDVARVTIECGNHEVSVTYVGFTLDGTPVYQDPTPDLSCTAGYGDTKVYDFAPALDINDFEFDYICDGGALTHVVIPSGTFYFHMPLHLVCPSPGGTIGLDPSPPIAGEAFLIVSDHEALEWPGSECFQFRGGPYDYVCVTWYCAADYPPEFHITPGCSDCNDPYANPNCPEAIYTDIAYGPICNPVPNIYCRIFWPIGLVQPGCWCYHFDYQLPVELENFSAIAENGSIRLAFATASEMNNDRFEIWRGTEQYGSFSEITRIPSQGDAVSRQNYEFVDRDVTPGVTYWYYLTATDMDGHRVEYRDRIQAVTATSGPLPTEYALSAYPNPFNPATTIAFNLPIDNFVTLRVYDMVGRLVEELATAKFTAGEHKIVFDASSLPSGIYLARIEAANFVSTTKLLLLK